VSASFATDVEERANAWMIQSGDSPGFPLKPLQSTSV
jgi:hypothetical protein